MNRGDLVRRVGEKTGLAYDVSGQEQTMLQDWANEAVVDVLLRTHIYLKIGDLALTSGTAEYRMDSTVLAIDDGRGSTPAGIGHYLVIGLDEMIQRQSADPATAATRKMIAIEGDLLIVYPTPSSDETLRFYYVPKPTVMSNDSHDPSSSTYGGIPTQYHRAIEYYMLWQASEYDDKQVALKPLDYKQLYMQECSDVRKEKRKNRDRRLTRARIGYPESRTMSVRNDVYPYYDGID